MMLMYLCVNVFYVWMDLCSLGLDGCECEYDEIYYITSVYQEEYEIVTGVWVDECNVEDCLCLDGCSLCLDECSLCLDGFM